jgi:hypothetical protein
MRTGWLRLLTKRRLMLALAVLAAALVPLAALGAARDWWFFRDHGPTPVSAPPGVVKEGEWSGHPWQLIAYPSGTDGLCVSVAPAGSTAGGSSGATSCGAFVGVPRTAETRGSSGMTILSSTASSELPAYIAGSVIDKASTVEIQFGTGEVLRLPTFSGAASLGHVRFYAAQLPTSIQLPHPRLAQPSFINKLAGLDGDGNVVACLVPQTMVDGVSPLSDCQ